MTIVKAVLATAIFIVVLHLSYSWFYLDFYFDFSGLRLMYSVLISKFLMLAAVSIFLYKSSQTKRIRLTKTPLYYYPYALLFGLAYIFLQLPLNEFYNTYIQEGHQMHLQFTPNQVFSIFSISIIIIGPITEELFFREYIQKNLQRRINPILTIFIVAILFSSIHLGYDAFFFESVDLDFYHTYITFFGGIICGVFYYLSKSLGPSILFHMAWNFGAVIF